MKKLPAQLSDQTDIFRKLYLPADTLWFPKTVGRVLGYTTEETFWWLLLDFSFIIFLLIFATHWTNKNQIFSILKHILSLLSKVMILIKKGNIMNFPFCKISFLCKENNNLVAVTWDHTFYSRRHHKKISSNLLL